MRSPFLCLASFSLINNKRNSPFKVFGTSEITEFKDSFIGEKNVGTFEVFVHDFMLVKIIKSHDKLPSEKEEGF